MSQKTDLSLDPAQLKKRSRTDPSLDPAQLKKRSRIPSRGEIRNPSQDLDPSLGVKRDLEVGLRARIGRRREHEAVPNRDQGLLI